MNATKATKAVAQRKDSSLQDHRTRNRILEAAGLIFSEKGYDRGTAREICELAQVNPAAVNYHFGGKEQLYVTVVHEADSRIIDRQRLRAILDGEGSPEEKLAHFISALVHALLGTDSETWYVRLFIREMSAPTMALEGVFQNEIRPTMMVFRKIVAEIMGLPPDHQTVIRGSFSAIGQCLSLFQNRQAFSRFLSELDIGPESLGSLARHISIFSLGGCRAVAEDAKRGGNT